MADEQEEAKVEESTEVKEEAGTDETKEEGKTDEVSE